MTPDSDKDWSKLLSGLFSKPQRPRRSLRQVWIDFYYLSSAHGIAQAAAASSRTLRFFWICTFLVCMVVMLIQLCFVLQQYFKYDVIVHRTIKYENGVFPAVTLCSLNPYKSSKIQSSSAALQTLTVLQEQLDQVANDKMNISHKTKPTSHKEDNETRVKREVRDSRPRFEPAFAECACETSRTDGVCIPRPLSKLAGEFTFPRNKYRRVLCICELETYSNTVWFCYPAPNWNYQECTDCQADGRCPPSVHKPSIDIGNTNSCFCQKHYPYCLATVSESIVTYGETKLYEKPMIISSQEQKDAATTVAPDVVIALEGEKENMDELAIKSRGQENIILAVAAIKEEDREEMAYNRDEIIQKCSFDRRDCDSRNDFKLYMDPTYGNCYTFNVNQSSPKMSSRPGSTYGLRVVLYSDPSELLPTTEAMGFRVDIHSSKDVPMPENYGYSVPLGTMSSFAIIRQEIKRLGYPHGECLDEDDVDRSTYLYSDFAYSNEACFRSCLQRTTLQLCSCADPRFAIPHGEHTICAAHNLQHRRCLEDLAKNQVLIRQQCNCKSPCRETKFLKSTSFATWPSHSSQVAACKPGNLTCQHQYRENAGMVEVYYEHLSYEIIEETAAYPLANLLADVGGLLGLWLGLSVISCLEFLMLIYDLLHTTRRDRREQRDRRRAFRGALPSKDTNGDQEDDLNHLHKPSRDKRQDSLALPCICDCSPLRHERNCHYHPWNITSYARAASFITKDDQESALSNPYGDSDDGDNEMEEQTGATDTNRVISAAPNHSDKKNKPAQL